MTGWCLALALALAQEPVTPELLPVLDWDPAPAVGVESTVILRDDLERAVPGATVQVVYRPDLDGEMQRAVGITDSRGRVRWTPEVGGVAQVRAGHESRRVAVAWAGPPAGATTLLVLLGLAGLGFTGYGWRPRSARRRRET